MKGLVIEQVLDGSAAAELGVEAGDRLLAINEQPLRDLIDYSYFTATGDELLLEVEKSDGELWELELELSPGEPLGLVFEAPRPARCANNCIFCFVHQLPRGLRRPLYVKDEDYRLSFLNGNYVTLANLKAAELRRIIDQRLSPLYISVHTTDPALREQMLGKRGIPPILEQLRTLAAGRIAMHCQIVLCPGVNDGAALERTVADLAALHPAVRSLAVVPLGLTSHRVGLPPLTPVDGAYARRLLLDWEPRVRKLRRRLGEPFLFLADEFYLKAGLPFPPLRSYGDLPQIENGVGLVPCFLRDARRLLRRARPLGALRATVVTGVSAYPFVAEFVAELGRRTAAELQVIAVPNRLFGASVTVSGLVSGRDIRAALEGHDPGAALLVPDVMLKEGEGIFLDDMGLVQLSEELRCPVTSFDSTPVGLYKVLRAIARRPRLHPAC